MNTQLRAVKVYEEINRVLAGRIDFNDLVDTVGRSFTQYDLDSAYLAWTSMFTKLDPVYTQSGSYNEDKLLDLIEHIEASTGDTATIVGTRKALRKITTATMGEQAKSDLYSMGYLGHIAGTPMVAMKQRHKIGSTEFILPDDTVYIFAGDTKPVKRVTEGEVTMLMGDPMNKADLTQEFLMTKRTGVSIILDRDFGSYKFA